MDRLITEFCSWSGEGQFLAGLMFGLFALAVLNRLLAFAGKLLRPPARPGGASPYIRKGGDNGPAGTEAVHPGQAESLSS